MPKIRKIWDGIKVNLCINILKSFKNHIFFSLKIIFKFGLLIIYEEIKLIEFQLNLKFSKSLLTKFGKY